MASKPIQFLNDDTRSTQWLSSLGVQDSKRGTANLRQIVSSKLPQQSLETLFSRLPNLLPPLSDPDRAINNLERFVSASPDAAEAMIVQDPSELADLLILFSASQYLSDLFIRDPENCEAIWQTKGQLVSRDYLVEFLALEIKKAKTIEDAMVTLRRFKQRETLRIGIGDLIVGHRIEQVTLQISFVASAIIESAYQWSRQNLARTLGEPANAKGEPSQFVVLAMGKLGGNELNYSSDIDLVFLYDENGSTSVDVTVDSPQLAPFKVTNQEFYERLCRQLVKLIGESTELGATFRVDLRLRPNGASGKICLPYQAMIQYYDLQGRTWERQALIKANPIAGDCELGERLLSDLSTWIYRRNLSRADIGGIKALKRKIERRAVASGEDRTNVKTGHGGIRDVEFIIQFMQLLNGGDLPEVRTTNTLDAIRQLEHSKCLSPAESTVLSQNYVWLRKLEHRLQTMFDLQTHTIPSDGDELGKVAKRMGFADADRKTALDQFRHTLNETTESNRKILNHLLHDSYGMAFGSMRDTGGLELRLDQEEVPLEVDLILDPDPDQEMIERVLRAYGFQKLNAAFSNLMDLARERSQFLSDRRCKHFLASVAPVLLAELSYTPDPDASLVTLATVSDCLGAKGVLWELFSFNPPTLSLYVRLCASSDYLVGILKSNPGMIDELVDALQLDALPPYQRLDSNMEELAKGAEDLVPIIHSFKNTQHMRVGVRDLLGRDDVRDTHRTLSDVAEICLKTAAQHQFEKLIAKYAIRSSDSKLQILECPLVILGLGKLGGREPNYHSDLDVIFLYDPNDATASQFEACLKPGVSSQFFFSELAAEITRFVSHWQGQGRLYEIDSRLRPTGKSGSLAVSMDEFKRYFESGQGALWERQALCKARAIFGSEANCSRAMELVHGAIKFHDWEPAMAAEIYQMRMALQKDCSERNLKRGEGGTVDVEFAIQMLQLKHASSDDSVLVPGTLEAIERLVSLGYLQLEVGNCLAQGYQLLRSVEARLRLMNTTARHDLPETDQQLAKLAYLLDYDSGEQLSLAVQECRTEIRGVFDSLFNQPS